MALASASLLVLNFFTNSSALEKAISLGKKSLSIFLLISIVVCLISFFIYEWMIRVLANSSYILKTSPLFGILLVGWIIFHTSNLHASLFLYASGDSKSVLYSNLIAVLFYFPLIIMLIKNQSLIGASLSFLITNVIKLGLQIVFFSKIKSGFLLKLKPIK